jgi:hypothetical protein
MKAASGASLRHGRAEIIGIEQHDRLAWRRERQALHHVGGDFREFAEFQGRIGVFRPRGLSA